MKHWIYYLLACIVLVLVAIFFWRQSGPPRELSVHTKGEVPPSKTIVKSGNKSGTSSLHSENQTDLPLKLPSGFSISYFMENLPGPRVLALDPRGNIVVSLTKAGKVAVLPDGNKSGKASEAKIILSNLSSPHGLLFMGIGTQTKLYVAETDKIIRYDYNTDTLSVSKPEKIKSLPRNGRHFTRTLLGLPDGNILVSIGSSCDTCVEKNGERASVLVMKPDGTGIRKYASGLRNSVFIRTHPQTGEVWATEMGRDYLGDNLPPDEINILKSGGFYGWPYCYGQKISDTSFIKATWANNICAKSIPSFIDIPAHSAPLGLTFVPAGWPTEYEGDLLVAYHGSWNRSIPTGYKVVRMKLDREGGYAGSEDFITGWLSNGKVSGRPVDLLIAPDGILYISDDMKGVIYRVAPD